MLDLIESKDFLLNRGNAQTIQLDVNGNPFEVVIQKPKNGNYVIVDYLNFSIGLEDLNIGFDAPAYSWVDTINELETLSEEDRLKALDIVGSIIGQKLCSLFGEDIDDVFGTLLYTGKGLFRYKYGFNIGSTERPLGKVALGGQNDTVLISLNGLGCAMAYGDWEKHLHDFLSQCQRPKITRIDLAHDDFDGAYCSVEDADEKESQGYFYTSGTVPKVQQLGGWKYNDSGRTFQIGKIENGKKTNIYEKGRQLGDDDSFWCRCEVQLSAQGRDIPFDILLKPTNYFCGYSPYTDWLIESAIAYKKKSTDVTTTPIRIPVIVKNSLISVNKSFEIWRKQAGRYIAFYREFFGNDSLILDLLMPQKQKTEYPKRLEYMTAIKQRTLFFQLIANKSKSVGFASPCGHTEVYA